MCAGSRWQLVMRTGCTKKFGFVPFGAAAKSSWRSIDPEILSGRGFGSCLVRQTRRRHKNRPPARVTRREAWVGLDSVTNSRQSPAGMAHILAFERPVVELITRVRELRELASEDDRFSSELEAARGQGRQVGARGLRQAFADAKGATVAAPQPPLHERLHLPLVRGFRRASR